MGWAIKRGDGTYRSWNGVAQDDALHPGETWEELASMPTLTLPISDVRAGAKALVDSLPEFVFRAFVEILIDEINIVRQSPTTTLASRTLAQFKTAMKNKIDAYV